MDHFINNVYIVQDFEATRQTCPEGLHYNPAAKWPEYACGYPMDVPCLSRGASRKLTFLWIPLEISATDYTTLFYHEFLLTKYANNYENLYFYYETSTYTMKTYVFRNKNHGR